jgi:hypothetical protein
MIKGLEAHAVAVGSFQGSTQCNQSVAADREVVKVRGSPGSRFAKTY